MNKVNALFAININDIDAFYNNWLFSNIGDRLANDFAEFDSGVNIIDVYKDNFCKVLISARNYWKVNQDGTQNKVLVTLYVADIVEPDWTDPSDPDPKDILTVVHYLRETFPGSIQILDCFKSDGVRHGQTLVPAIYDNTGSLITPEKIIGTPTYPSNPQTDTLLYMPDNVIYDIDGIEVSRTIATELTEVNNLVSWVNKRWL